MGCNVNIYLPPDVHGRDAVKVIGILAGLKPVRKNFDRGGGTYVDVAVAEEQASSVERMSELVIRAPKGSTLVDGDEQHNTSFHYSSRRNGKVFNLVMPTATPFWCAIGKNLIEWFGGVVQYNDCDVEKAPNVFRARRWCPTDKYGLLSQDGKSWERYQDELMQLRPLTSLELKRGRKVAAYADDFEADGITHKVDSLAQKKA
jgi:hypothetical protein